MKNRIFHIPTIFYTLVLFSITSISTAQKVGFGLKLGYNLNSIALNLKLSEAFTFVDARFLHSYHFGISLQNESSNNLGWQVDLLLHSNGGYIEVPTLLERTRLSMRQIRIPIVAKYKLFNNFHIHLGVYSGITLGRSAVMNELKESGVEAYSGLDFGLVGGGSYKLSQKMTLEIRFNYGVQDISTESQSGEILQFFSVGVKGYENRTTDVSLQYSF